MTRRAKYLNNEVMTEGHPDCKACVNLREHIDKMMVREMNLRVELGEARRKLVIKQQYANRTRW